MAQHAITLVALISALVVATPATAQHQHEEHPPGTDWTLHLSGQAFLTLNMQARKFRDFHQLESQNWAMAMLARSTPRWQVSVYTMATLEPFTLRRLGSAQVFQSGEQLDGLPLRDYQHPHDLVMGLGGRISRQVADRWTVFVDGGTVASPALGPTPFMHRASATPHPTAPLSHHMLDSTHITHGVITGGVARGPWQVELSSFHGREPDDDRIRLDMGPLDSWSGRLTYRSSSVLAQVSAARVHEPEAIEPGDATRLTASVEWRSPSGAAVSVAAGRNDHGDHVEWGWLAEAVHPVTGLWSVYTRAEVVDRFILVDFDYAARTGRERHQRSRISAWLIGVDRALWRGADTDLAAGMDVTLHHTPRNLRDSYGFPVSAHVFLRLGRK